MADKIDIVIQKNVSTPSLGDGQSKSMAAEQEGTGSSQHRPGASSLDTEWDNDELGPEDTENSFQIEPPKIPKVPRMFRDVNKEHYDPLVVSIGPYHRNKMQFEGTKKLKTIMMKELVDESQKPRKDFYNSMVNEVKDVKEYYDKESTKDLDDKNFHDIIFLDGCFILQFIICFLRKPESLKMTRHVAALVIRDLFLLENQIPFEVLRSLLNVRFEKEKERRKLINDFIVKVRAIPPQKDTCTKRIENFIAKYIVREEQRSEENTELEGYQSAIHLLELLRLQFIEKAEKDENKLEYDWYRYRPATELKNVGIHFAPSRTHLSWDVIRFQPKCFGGVLKLPPVTIDDSTKSKFLNLVAYESYHVTFIEQGVTSYVCFMDSLIDSAADVRELRSKGIILNTLGGDQEVADLFNEIANNLIPNPRAYAKVKKDIESHYQNFFKLWMIRHKDDISLATAKYASLFGVIFTALKVVFPAESTCIENFKLMSTNFTRGP